MVHEELLLGRNASLGGNSIQPSVNETGHFFFPQNHKHDVKAD